MPRFDDWTRSVAAVPFSEVAIGLSCAVISLALAWLIYRGRRALPFGGTSTRFRALLEAAPDATITVAEDGRITLVNSQTETLFGYARHELIGQAIEILLPEQLRHAHLAHRRDFHAQPRRRPMGSGLDLVARRKDGSEFPTEISLSPLHTDEGLAVIVVVRDITERKKADQERVALVREQAARSEAEAANRAKDDFVAVVSHELRTPLNAILGWTTLLQSRSLERDVAEHALKAIERNAQAQRQVIDDLLDVSRMVTGKMSLDLQEVEIAQVIAAAVDSVRPAVEAKRLHLDVLVDPALPSILGDPRRLQQVMWNLLSNAAKFTPEEGGIRVSAVPQESHIRVQVADTGSGIDQALLPHVFERFRQRDSSATRAHGGLGLGLAIARQLVDLHGGTIEAESAGEGQGALFTLMLPVPEGLGHRARHLAGGADEGKPGPAAEMPDLHGVHVLAVDDDAETRELLQAVLTRAGAEVIVASSGAEALADLERDVPDVLMSDLAMPDLDGYELIKRVHEQRPALPSIALTAHRSTEVRDRAQAAGFAKHLTKPVLPRELLSMVATVTREDRGAPD
jgi:hypothetical protein